MVDGMKMLLCLLTAWQAASHTCLLTVPSSPLSPTGLATPYTVSGCDQYNPNQATFIEGAIYDPATSVVSIYNPLVINAGSSAAIAPTVPTLPANAIVALWFTTMADSIVLAGPGASDCKSTTAFSYCSAPAFFRAARRAVLPDLGVASDGITCPTILDFLVVDTTPSDALLTTYLLTANGIAQNTVANRAKMVNATPISMGLDDQAIYLKMALALGCRPPTAPDMTDPSGSARASSLAMNCLMAQAYQQEPIAFVPDNDPLVTRNGQPDLETRNLYRRLPASITPYMKSLSHPLPPFQLIALSSAGIGESESASGNTRTYCINLATVQPARLLSNQAKLEGIASPDPSQANNLFTYMSKRFISAYGLLNCPALLADKQQPIVCTIDSDHVARQCRIVPFVPLVPFQPASHLRVIILAIAIPLLFLVTCIIVNLSRQQFCHSSGGNIDSDLKDRKHVLKSPQP